MIQKVLLYNLKFTKIFRHYINQLNLRFHWENCYIVFREAVRSVTELFKVSCAETKSIKTSCSATPDGYRSNSSNHMITEYRKE